MGGAGIGIGSWILNAESAGHVPSIIGSLLSVKFARMGENPGLNNQGRLRENLLLYIIC